MARRGKSLAFCWVYRQYRQSIQSQIFCKTLQEMASCAMILVLNCGGIVGVLPYDENVDQA